MEQKIDILVEDLLNLAYCVEIGCYIPLAKQDKNIVLRNKEKLFSILLDNGIELEQVSKHDVYRLPPNISVFDVGNCFPPYVGGVVRSKDVIKLIFRRCTKYIDLKARRIQQFSYMDNYNESLTLIAFINSPEEIYKQGEWSIK